DLSPPPPPPMPRHRPTRCRPRRPNPCSRRQCRPTRPTCRCRRARCREPGRPRPPT
ncbi:triacylglycerol lipase, partial [Lysobacter lacus]